MALRIQLFGEFQTWCDEADLTPILTHLGKPKLLLKIFLTRPDHLFSQEELIELLWPDISVQVAYANLRKRISELRHVLEPTMAHGSESAYILTRSAHYCLNPAAPYVTDTQEFLRAREAGQVSEEARHFSKAVAHYRRAAELVRDGYLPEDRYAEWALDTIAEWEERQLTLVEHLIECYLQLGQYEDALAQCRQGLRVRVWRESLYRKKMLCHYYAGEPCEAMKTYQTCLRVLLDELEMAPSQETQSLREQIAHNALPSVKTSARALESFSSRHEARTAAGA